MLEDQKSTIQPAAPLWLMAIPFVIALVIRLVGLGQPFLDNVEANVALGIREMVMGQSGVVTQPLYSQITGGLFWLFEDSNFVARLLPALMGSLLVVFPWFLGNSITNRQKFVLSVGLALDPALIAASKTGSSLMLAVVAMAAMLLALSKRKPVLLGVSFAALLLTGSYFLTGLIILVITLLWVLTKSDHSEVIKQEVMQFGWKKGLISFAVSYILMASFVFTQPSGIGAGIQDMASLLGNPDPYKVTIGIGAMLFALVVYELFPLMVSIFSITAYRRELTTLSAFSLRWILVGFMVILLHGNRVALDLVWLSIPLWIVASFGIDKMIVGVGKIQPLAVASAGFYLLLLGFVLFTWVGAVNIEFDQQRLMIRVGLIAGGLLLVVIFFIFTRFLWDVEIWFLRILIGFGSAVFLFGFIINRVEFIVGGLLLVLISFVLTNSSWNRETANQGLLIGIGSMLLLFGLITQSWHSANWGNHPQNELWRTGSYPVDAALLSVTIEDLSEMNRGRRVGQELLIYALDVPAVEWHLRQQAIKNVISFSGADNPEMILSDLVEPEFWSAEYAGQDFLLGAMPDWSLLTWREWQQWIIFRSMPVHSQEWGILWVRTDLFPSAATSQ